jgi:hypothetical protein
MHTRESSGSKQSWNKIFGTNVPGLSQIILFTTKHTFSRPSSRKKRIQGRKEEEDLIKRISPIAWQNVNLLGRFEFHRQESVINIDEMIDLVEQRIIWQQPKIVEKVLV